MTVNEDYSRETTCIYKGETFSVRDNGAIMRHSVPGCRKRKNDDIWSFGQKNTQGYAIWAGVRVHQVVTTAFHGKPELNTYVVDHIDTNRMNNRPENLRWCSRLENLLNDNTVWNLEYLTGIPVEEILKNPSILKSYNLPKDLSAMRSVTQREATLISEHLKERNKISALQIHKPITYPKGIKASLTSNATQPYKWADYEFPACPENKDASLEEYYANLNVGDIVTQSKQMFFIIEDKDWNRWNNRICLKTRTVRKDGDIPPKAYGVMVISKYNDYFIHTGTSLFQEDSMEKYYTIAKGYTWKGGEVFDDGCM